MTGSTHQPRWLAVVEAASGHHDVIDRGQLIDLGLGRHAIAHALRSARLHKTRFRGVYATVPKLGRRGRWYAATRHCSPDAGLSHGSGAAFYELGVERLGTIELSVVGWTPRRHEDLVVHRRSTAVGALFEIRDSIKVTSPALTIIDLSTRLSDRGLDRVINEAVGRDLTSVQKVRDTAAEHPRVPGAARVRNHLDRRTFLMTRSMLEREFIPLLRRAGLPAPQTLVMLNGFEVDFWIPEFRLVIETDSWGWHRTPAQLERDTKRDHAHIAAGMVPLRFSHEQIHYDAAYVVGVLRGVVARIGRAP